MTLLMQALKKQAAESGIAPKAVTSSKKNEASSCSCRPLNGAQTITRTMSPSPAKKTTFQQYSVAPKINNAHVILRKQQIHQEMLLYELAKESTRKKRHQQTQEQNYPHRNGWMLKLAVCSFSISLLLGALMYQQIHTPTEVATVVEASTPTTTTVAEETEKPEDNFLAKRSSPFRDIESTQNNSLVSLAQVENITPSDAHFQKQQQERINSLIIQGIAVLPQGGKVRIDNKVYSVGEFIRVQEENFLFKGIRNQQLIFSDRKGNIYQRSFQNKDL